ncbi:hypothetical protein EVAR_54804_1 [Eumeta japonica]|uniref:Uncharacterized protein n=1 Tax=Eumeta variegata TaxID=151549 RepID=A0A4C1Y4S0_EUMVA|nr:hypothetical protein EVAR_54804_1 [Eumeta japonica]
MAFKDVHREEYGDRDEDGIQIEMIRIDNRHFLLFRMRTAVLLLLLLALREAMSTGFLFPKNFWSEYGLDAKEVAKKLGIDDGDGSSAGNKRKISADEQLFRNFIFGTEPARPRARRPACDGPKGLLHLQC